jgi:hypothetical protein
MDDEKEKAFKMANKIITKVALENKAKLLELEEELNYQYKRRERNIDRYILPVEIKIARLEEKIEKLKGKIL